jgi:ABC-type dipeptide/oligopeptide/nickel transport system permease subunit
METALQIMGTAAIRQVPGPEGVLVADGRPFMFAASWMLFGPATALATVVYGVNTFGVSLRDIFDPRLRDA